MGDISELRPQQPSCSIAPHALVKERMRYLTAGKFALASPANTTAFEYQLPQMREMLGRPPRHLGLSCLKDKSILLLGDSRVRYLWGALLGLLSLDRPGCPPYRKCPFANEPGVHSQKCAAFYYEYGRHNNATQHQQCNLFRTHGMRLSYHQQVFEATPLSMEAVAELQTADVVLLTVGAWPNICRQCLTSSE